MKLPDLPPFYLRPPDVKRAVIMCQAEGIFRPHDYDGKDALWAMDNRLTDLRLRFRCDECGNVRWWGNEQVTTMHHRDEAAVKKAIAAELAASEDGGG